MQLGLGPGLALRLRLGLELGLELEPMSSRKSSFRRLHMGTCCTTWSPTVHFLFIKIQGVSSATRIIISIIYVLPCTLFSRINLGGCRLLQS